MTNKTGQPQANSPHRAILIWLFIGAICIPGLYLANTISIETVNQLGYFLTFAIVAVGLDLIWGYAGILSLCQAFFFCLGGYAMGMYLAHHGVAAGYVDTNGWKIPASLFFVSSDPSGNEIVPWFWKPFWSLPVTVVLALLIPGLIALAIGFFGFRSRVRGVYFAILTQAITVAAVLFFGDNDMKFCGTNGLSNFHRFTFGNRERIEILVVSEEDLKKIGRGLEALKKKQARIIGESMGKAEAAKLLEQELAVEWGQLKKSVGHLPAKVSASLQKVDEKLDDCVKAFQGEDEAVPVGKAMDGLSLALAQAGRAGEEALALRPIRLKEVQAALEQRREEPRATTIINVNRKRHHLGQPSGVDGNQTDPAPEGMELNVSFEFNFFGDKRPFTLAIEQRDVHDEWLVFLNDQKLGSLERDPAKQVTQLAIPSEVFTKGENQLTIRPASDQSRNAVVLGHIRLFAGEVPALGGTLEQQGNRFLSIPKFGVNIDNDYSQLVIHGDAKNNVDLQDWATVKPLGPKLTGKSVQLILYLITVLALAAVYWMCQSLVKSRLGRVLIAIRDDENTLRFSGYRPYVYKLFAFVLAGMIAGLAGMLYVPQKTIIVPDDMLAIKSILIVVWVAVGGRGTLAGAVLGALVVNYLYDYSTSPHDLWLFTWKPEYWPFVLGGLFVAVVLWMKGGLLGLPSQVMQLLKRFGVGAAKKKNQP